MKGRILYQNDSGVALDLPRDPAEQVRIGSDPGDHILVNAAGVESGHLSLRWMPQLATWEFRCDAPGGSPTLNGAICSSGMQVPLNNGDVFELGGYQFHFEKLPTPPEVNGQPKAVISLSADNEWVFGRHSDEEATGNFRWDLDPDDRTVSKRHARIFQKDKYYVLESITRGGTTELNGRICRQQALVYGDRFRIGQYSFEFQGGIVRHVPQRSGFAVVAEDVSVAVPVKGGKKTILNEISIGIETGEFIGILGGSGQGKSTMLNALCGINPATSGRVLLDGVPLKDRNQLRSLSIGYVPQDDIVHSELTVEDAVMFSAKLRLKLKAHERATLVSGIIERLGLTEHRSKRISNLSGGQRKRVSIATELLAKPAILFLDEPSSGLDPATEMDLMTFLQDLSLTGLTVTCTTHVLQNAFLFNRIAFIHEGRVVFCGSADQARMHFLMPKADESRTASVRERQLEKIFPLLHTKSGKEWEDEYSASRFAPKLPAIPPGSEHQNPPQPRPKVGYLRTLMVLLKRQWRILRADPLNLVFLLAQAIAIGGMVGWVSDDPGLRLFLCVIATMWFGCSNGAQQIVQELPIFRRERVSGMGINAYIHSKFVFLTVITAFQCLLMFITVTVSAMFFNPPDDPVEAISTELDARLAVVGATRDNADADGGTGYNFEAVGEDDPGTLKAMNADDLSMPSRDLLIFLADYFNLRKNIEGTLADSRFAIAAWYNGEVKRKKSIDESEAQRRFRAATKRDFAVIGSSLALRAMAFGIAILLGVSLGLMVSSLVQNGTQAVMWVPLILIPQILFGGYVVNPPEMIPSVRQFCQFVPSYCSQQVMDVSHIYGQSTPKMTNKTKIPGFVFAADEKETVEWVRGGRPGSEKYEQPSPHNKSWQNLAVLHNRVGKRNIQPGTGSGGKPDSIDERADVLYEKYGRGPGEDPIPVLYLDPSPAYTGSAIAGAWLVGCYLVIFLALRKRQTGR